MTVHPRDDRVYKTRCNYRIGMVSSGFNKSPLRSERCIWNLSSAMDWKWYTLILCVVLATLQAYSFSDTNLIVIPQCFEINCTFCKSSFREKEDWWWPKEQNYWGTGKVIRVGNACIPIFKKVSSVDLWPIMR